MARLYKIYISTFGFYYFLLPHWQKNNALGHLPLYIAYLCAKISTQYYGKKTKRHSFSAVRGW